MRDIDLHQIEIFISVARHQNISRAAQELYISQPAISNWITKMESDCGMKLFNRTNRGVSLTPEGEELYARLDIVYNRFRVSVSEICQNADMKNPNLRVGCLNRRETVRAAACAVQAYRKVCPDEPVFEEMFNFHELRNKLLCEELDFIFSISFDIEAYSEFEFRALHPFETFFTVSEEWKREIDSGAGLQFLNGKTLIIEAPTGLESALAACHAEGFEPSNVRYVSSYILMSSLASHSRGFSIAGIFAQKDYYYPRVSVIPATKGRRADVVLAWRRGRQTPEMQRFLNLVDNEFQEIKNP